MLVASPLNGPPVQWPLMVGLLLCLTVIGGAWPLPQATRAVADGLEVPPPEILRFMRRFGYLEPSPEDSEALYHESAIVEAIKNVQKFGALNQTGKLDAKTRQLFEQPRCGVADLEGVPYYLQRSTVRTMRRHRGGGPSRRRPRRYVVGARPWERRHIRYYIANWSRKMSAETIVQVLERAFGMWAQYSGLHFERVNHTAAEIIVGFGTRYHGDSYPFDGPGNILAHAFYPYEGGSYGGDLHFDEDENWTVASQTSPNEVDFYAVAVHELGHSLGLAHSPIYDSIMFPYYKGGAESKLAEDDTQAMNDIYLTKRLEDDEADVNNVHHYEEPEDEEEEDDEMPEESQEHLAAPPPTTAAPTPTKSTTTETGIFRPTYQGDYETVTQHKARYSLNTKDLQPNEHTSSARPVTQSMRPPSVNATTTPTRIPNICAGQFDAVTAINGAMHFFKGPFVWRITDRYTIEEGYPIPLAALFPALPAQTARIDAAYERQDGALVLFTGSMFWVLAAGVTPIENSPQPIERLIGSAGVAAVTRINAALLWPRNNRTYFFGDRQFWRYDEGLRRLEPGYPRSMSHWPGLPSSIDAAATLRSGKTYFFKNNLYWLYNNEHVRPESGYPRRASLVWLGCPRLTKTPLRNFNTTVTFISS